MFEAHKVIEEIGAMHGSAEWTMVVSMGDKWMVARVVWVVDCIHMLSPMAALVPTDPFIAKESFGSGQFKASDPASNQNCIFHGTLQLLIQQRYFLHHLSHLWFPSSRWSNIFRWKSDEIFCYCTYPYMCPFFLSLEIFFHISINIFWLLGLIDVPSSAPLTPISLAGCFNSSYVKQ